MMNKPQIERVKILPGEYSSFRNQIISYFDTKVLPFAKTVLDPMAGTAPLIPYITKHGNKAFFNDIVPLHFFINKAKTIPVYRCIKAMSETQPNYLMAEISSCLVKMKGKKLIISDKWIPDENLDGLIYAWKKSDKYDENISVFIKAIILLCVRPYSSITRSEKNATWYRPGGMSNDAVLTTVIKEAVSKYLSYYNNAYAKLSENLPNEACTISMGDAEQLHLPTKVDVILTSPAYANRYDIVKMYGPELYLLATLGISPEIDCLKNCTLATNVVSDYKSYSKDLSILRDIAPKTHEFLIAVKEKQLTGEGEYYLRYFTKYYSKLYKIFDHLLSLLSDKGSLYIAVQNNIHRGELNAMDSFLEEYFNNKRYTVAHVYTELVHHQGRRNISADHPLVLKKHAETILRVRK